MIHSKADLPQSSKKIPLENPAIQPVFGSGKNYLLELFRLCPKKSSLPVQCKKISPSKLENRIMLFKNRAGFLMYYIS